MSTNEHTDVVRESFTRQAGIFTGDNSPFARRFASPLAWIEPLDGTMVVLDVACGAAHASEQAAPHVRQVVGIDITPALLAVGAERLAAAGVGNVILQQGDANALPFADASFDLVVCRSSVHHFTNPAVVLAEMARVCRPGGRVVISDVVAPSAETRDAFDALHRLIDPSHVRALVESELADLVANTVGRITYGDTAQTSLPAAAFLTDAGDPDAAMQTLRAELRGGTPTGFAPVADGDQVLVTFTGTVVHAIH